MSDRSYHGDIAPADLARALIATFNQGNMQCQQVGQGDKVMVQIAVRDHARSGGQGALSVSVQRNADGVTVGIGQHEWLGAAASLGQTALVTLMNPWNIVGRLDDIAQDITSLTLEQQVWDTIEKYAHTAKATKTLSARLETLVCPYCNSANKVAAANCVSCGAPLGEAQPVACPKCGNVVAAKTKFCPNCGTALP
jgi:RNA polymerase subunit RPABC4/transcription elongation factor Spt4